MLKKGLYTFKNSSRIVYITNVRFFKDLKSEFYIVTWEQSDGVFPKTLIEDESEFIRVGNL